MKQMTFIFRSFIVVCFVLYDHSFSYSQVDSHTLLYLSFDETLKGEQGEVPVLINGPSFNKNGYKGQCVYFNSSASEIKFNSNNNINETVGTLEFWIKPDNWIPSNGYYILTYGGAGGMVFAKDGTNSMRAIFSQFATPYPELDLAYSIGSWTVPSWHYVVYTWDTDTLNLYLDGVHVDADKYCIDMPPVTCFTFPDIDNSSTINIGNSQAYIDELIISGIARNAAYINNRFTMVNEPPSPVYAPVVYELLSPNKDGKNELFYIENLDKFPENELKVMNSWGQQVFHQMAYNNSWDGASVPDGTYFYFFKFKRENGEEDSINGSLVIQR